MAFINNTLITFITACFFTLALYLKFGLKWYYTYIILLWVILCVYFLNKYISEYKYKTNILKNWIPAIWHIDRCTRINWVDAYKLFIKYTCKNWEYHEFEEVILHSILNYSKAGSMSDILDKGGLMDLHYLLKSNKINVDIIYNKNDPSKWTLAKNFKIFFEKNDSSILDIKEKGKIILNNENINTNTNSQKIDFAYFDTKKIIKNSVISIIIMVISYTILFQYNIITDWIVNKCTTCFWIIILFMIPLILIFCALLLIFNYKLVKSLWRLLLLYLLKLFPFHVIAFLTWRGVYSCIWRLCFMASYITTPLAWETSIQVVILFWK